MTQDRRDERNRRPAAWEAAVALLVIVLVLGSAWWASRDGRESSVTQSACGQQLVPSEVLPQLDAGLDEWGHIVRARADAIGGQVELTALEDGTIEVESAGIDLDCLLDGLPPRLVPAHSPGS